MRYINASQAPSELIAWVAQQRKAGVNLHYDYLGIVEVGGHTVDVKEAVLKQRLKDQGFLCAYTMLRIDPDNAHIEHLVPRTVSNQAGRPDETIDYNNMVACFPKNGGDKNHGFGAPVRADRSLAVTPIDPSCERRIRYRDDGFVEALDRNDKALVEQIDDVLKLNARLLVRGRRESLCKAGITSDSPNPLSIGEAERLASGIVTFRPGGKLTQFCIAINQVAEAHVERIKKIQKKRAFSRRPNS